MSKLDYSVLVIAERTPVYNEGSGDQKFIHTSYYQLDNVHFCIINDNTNRPTTSEVHLTYTDIPNTYNDPGRKWRYADLINSFTMNQDRFLLSEKYLAQITGKVAELINEQGIQIIVFEQTGIPMWSWYRKFTDQVKCVLRIHDSLYHYFLSDATTRKKTISKIALLGMAWNQKKYENNHIRQWDQIQFLSQKEIKSYRTAYPEIADKFVYTPPSIFVNRNEYLSNPVKTIDILFVGTMSWKPNTDAVRWFLTKVYPLIKLELPDVKVRIVGKEATQKIISPDQNVEVIGFIPNIENEFKLAKLFINPSQSGGGIKIKLLQASALGVPVISTSNGVSGYKDNIRECLVVEDEPADFARAVIDLLRNDDLREDYSRRIFDYAQKEFNIQENQKMWKASINKIL